MLSNLNRYSSLIQAIAVIIALGYAAWQTRQLGKQIRLNMITATGAHLKEVNQLIVEHPELASMVGGTSEGAFADIVFGTFELWFDLKEQGLIGRKEWKRYVITIRKVMNHDKMKEAWQRDRDEYWEGFRTYVDKFV